MPRGEEDYADNYGSAKRHNLGDVAELHCMSVEQEREGLCDEIPESRHGTKDGESDAGIVPGSCEVELQIIPEPLDFKCITHG